MIFTPQCLVSRYNLAKIDPINIKSKQLYSPHFGIRYIVWWQRRNRVRVDVLLTPCSPGRNRAKHRDSREIKTKTSFTRVFTRILLQITVLFVRVHRNFCTVSALEWLFWMTPQGCIEPIMLHWVQIAIIVSLRNRTARKRRTAKRVCVTNVTGLLLVCVVVIFTKFQCFGVFFNKICVKEDGWSLRQPFFKQNYCHARFAVFLALPSCCVSSLILKWLQQ